MENQDETRGKGKAVMKREFVGTVIPVSPGASGEGLPYAPEHWPNPGDIWTWRVGYRFSNQGIFHDRYLRAPLRLRKGQTISLQSKPAVERYVRSKFPDADISAFFDSFTWVIRVKPELIGKYVHSPRIRRPPMKKLKKNRGDAVNKRMKKTIKSPKKEIASGHGCINLSVDIAVGGEEALPSSSKGLASTSFLGNQVSDDFNVSQAHNLDSLVDLSPDEFDNYLKSLDETLDSPPHSMHQSSSSMEEAMAISRRKLSLILSNGTPNCLLPSDTTNELIALSYKLQNDPNLSIEQLSILKLIQSIPFISNSFLETKEISSKAEEFFNSLNAKTASVASLKEEYNASKEEVEAIQADEASKLLDIMDIDQEISKLEKLRDEKSVRVKAHSERLIHLDSIQKKVMGTLPKLVNEVKMAKSEISTWELKKNKAAELEAEILSRFAPLDGFSF